MKAFTFLLMLIISTGSALKSQVIFQQTTVTTMHPVVRPAAYRMDPPRRSLSRLIYEHNQCAQVHLPATPDQVMFSAMLQHIAAQSFDSNRLQVAKQIASGNTLSSAHVAAILTVFSFESTRLDFAKFAWSRVIDPQNYFLVNQSFGFSSSVDELYRYTTGWN